MHPQPQRFETRQSMEGHAFEVFHYKDINLQEVPLHHHDFYEVYLFLSGEVDYVVEGQHYRPVSGDVLLVNPMELHQLRNLNSEKPYERIVLWLSQGFFAHFSAEQSLTLCFDNGRPHHTNLLRPTPERRAALFSMLNELVGETRGNGYAADACASGMVLQALVLLNRIALEQKPALSGRRAGDARIDDVLQYINLHYGEAITLDSLSAQFFTSKYHLAHEFSRVVGTSLHRYLTLKRLVIAKQLLGAGLAPGEVYRHCGFNNYTTFYRAFHSEYGVSPRNYAQLTAQG